ncbi:MAG: Oxidoreductase, short chain dehydrogenase/reductase family [uncultured Thermomicrobiales bacterium]|uniref:Oxidoreductase, short chain dehydrogenase/reductase family n=1 Tax=uncultured Thermomicrobiales bacterium TaxID=1645740 RepID=A0A6J4VZI0_9BACT|nr:MAG: Oxidoreductase, short chain dehydrogenase/reductase family [uncultured Thermomicrobiales bacterium]
MIRFDGQVALVTGAGRGLGAAYARAFADRGASVVVHDAGVGPEGTGFDPVPADATVAGIAEAGGTAAACYEDLASDEGCRATVTFALARFGRLDILVHNAGLLTFRPIEETDATLWRRLLAVNVEAPFFLSQAAFPQMKRQGYGRIVVTTSGRAMHLPWSQPGLTAYAVGKMAQLGLMNALAAEGEPHDIRVNAISPVAATRMLRRPATPGELDPAQVAPGLLFLASAACDFSGLILRAAGDRFSVARWAFSEGADFGPGPVTPETIAARWPDIASG